MRQNGWENYIKYLAILFVGLSVEISAETIIENVTFRAEEVDSIKCLVGGKVTIVCDPLAKKVSVKLEHDSARSGKFVSNVRDNELKIAYEQPRKTTWQFFNFGSDRDLVVTVTLPHFSKFDANGSGDYEVRRGNFSDFLVNILGSGDVRLFGDGNNLECNLKGSGNLVFNGTVVNNKIHASRSGDIIFNGNAINTEIHASGSGDVIVNGNADYIDVLATGSGDILLNTRGTVGQVDLVCGKSGNLKLPFVNTIEKLHVVSRGSGDVSIPLLERVEELAITISRSGRVLAPKCVAKTASLTVIGKGHIELGEIMSSTKLYNSGRGTIKFVKVETNKDEL